MNAAIAKFRVKLKREIRRMLNSIGFGSVGESIRELPTEKLEHMRSGLGEPEPQESAAVVEAELFSLRTQLFRNQLAADKKAFEAQMRADCESDPKYGDALYNHLCEPVRLEQMQNFRKRIFPNRG